MIINRIGSYGASLASLRAAVKALGPTLLLDADLVSGNDGDAIQTWADDSGNSRDFSQVFSNKRPLLKKAANGINGHNVLRFDGSDDCLDGPNASDLVSTKADSYWIVFKLFANDTNNTLQCPYNNTAIGCMTGCWGFVFLTGSGALTYLYNGSAYQSVANAISTSTPYIARSRHSSGNLYLRIDGGSEGSATGGTILDLAGATVLCKDPGASIYSQIDIAEIIIFNSALSAGDLAKVDAYLKLKYGTY